MQIRLPQNSKSQNLLLHYFVVINYLNNFKILRFFKFVDFTTATIILTFFLHSNGAFLWKYPIHLASLLVCALGGMIASLATFIASVV